MKAVILAGGLGSRLRPFTEIIPKPLLPIGEKSVLQIQIERLKMHGFGEIYFATNYKSEYICNFFGDGSNYGVNLKISKEKMSLGTAGPLSLLREELTEPFILMNGDILSTINFQRMYKRALIQESQLMVAIKTIIRPFEFGNIYYEGDYVIGIDEKPDLRNDILAGIYVIKPKILELIPDDTYFGMDQLIKYMLSEKMPVSRYHLDEFWLDIGQVADYEKAQEIYDTHFNK
jgi:NDP-mannose synthase